MRSCTLLHNILITELRMVLDCKYLLYDSEHFQAKSIIKLIKNTPLDIAQIEIK